MGWFSKAMGKIPGLPSMIQGERDKRHARTAAQHEGRANAWQEANSIDPNTGFIIGPGGEVPRRLARGVQAQHEQGIFKYRQQLMGDATRHQQGAMGLMESFRPGGGSQAAYGVFSNLANISMGRAQMTQPMDLMSDYRQGQLDKARKDAKKAATLGLVGQVAGAALGAVTGGVGGVAAAAAGGLGQGVGQAMMGQPAAGGGTQLGPGVGDPGQGYVGGNEVANTINSGGAVPAPPPGIAAPPTAPASGGVAPGAAPGARQAGPGGGAPGGMPAPGGGGAGAPVDENGNMMPGGMPGGGADGMSMSGEMIGARMPLGADGDYSLNAHARAAGDSHAGAASDAYVSIAMADMVEEEQDFIDFWELSVNQALLRRFVG